jgi:hypothetical protein
VKKSKNAAAAWEIEWKDESFVIELPDQSQEESSLCVLIYSHDGIGGDQLHGSFQVLKGPTSLLPGSSPCHETMLRTSMLRASMLRASISRHRCP